MPKKAGIFLVLAGTVLILSALSLFCYNRYEDAQAGQKAENLLVGVKSVMEGQREENPVPEEVSAEQDSELPVVEIDGYCYVGVLSIPALALELPVMSEWDYDRLQLAPCRQFGSSRTDDLVIAAHNYKSHFGLLDQLTIGDSVMFTDMEGIVNEYTVARMDTLQPTEVDAVQNSGYDLVLYTCTWSGTTRVVVYCERTAAVE